MPKVHSPQYLWCWKIYTALATTGIVPPRANIHAKSKEGGPVVEKVPSFGEDDVGDSIGKVVEKLGVGVRSVDISEDGKTSSNGAKTTNHGPSSGDTSPSSYTSASELSQEMRPSKEFLKTEEDFMRNKWLSEDFEATRMAAGD